MAILYTRPIEGIDWGKCDHTTVIREVFGQICITRYGCAFTSNAVVAISPCTQRDQLTCPGARQVAGVNDTIPTGLMPGKEKE